MGLPSDLPDSDDVSLEGLLLRDWFRAEIGPVGASIIFVSLI